MPTPDARRTKGRIFDSWRVWRVIHGVHPADGDGETRMAARIRWGVPISPGSGQGYTAQTTEIPETVDATIAEDSDILELKKRQRRVFLLQGSRVLAQVDVVGQLNISIKQEASRSSKIFPGNLSPLVPPNDEFDPIYILGHDHNIMETMGFGRSCLDLGFWMCGLWEAGK